MEKPVYIKEATPNINKDGSIHKRAIYRCYCGREYNVFISSVQSGRNKHCGCMKYMTDSLSRRSHGYTAIDATDMQKSMTHIWSSMKARCYNINCKVYNRYGGRGITICSRWLESFENFVEDMGIRPEKGYSLDRIDNDKGYSKENCRWATSKQQNRNRRDIPYIEYKGESKSVAEWSEITGIKITTLWTRIYTRNWSIEKAMEEPVRWSSRVF